MKTLTEEQKVNTLIEALKDNELEWVNWARQAIAILNSVKKNTTYTVDIEKVISSVPTDPSSRGDENA